MTLSRKPVVLISATCGAVVILLALALAVVPHAKATPVPTAEVQITAGGFTPATIQVKPGTQVTWLNQDTKSRQVASDPYPLDNALPNFNSRTPLAHGDTYSYTFDQAGSYTYHDNLNAFGSLKGRVVVRP